jgi:hypothetical protein
MPSTVSGTKQADHLPSLGQTPTHAVLACGSSHCHIQPVKRSREPSLVELAEWSGLVHGRDDSFNALEAVILTPLPQRTWSGPFRVTASNQRDYFVKALETCPPGQGASLAVEQIVSQVGKLIGAPVCDTSLIRIPAALAGWQPAAGGSAIQGGLAHASLAIEHADFRRPPLESRLSDDNARRHVGVYALCDWCFSTDEQWLYDLDDDQALYSHDHGLYLPPLGQGRWTRTELVAHVDTPHEWPDPRKDLSIAACHDVANALEHVKRESLIQVLRSIPASWPVSDEDLEALGWFLERRAPVVASRVRVLA